VSIRTVVGLVTLLSGAAVASAQTAPSLGAAQSYAVLGGSTVTNAGPSVIGGDLGLSPGTAVTGFPPGVVAGGAIHAADAVALSAQNSLTAAYNSVAGQACTQDLTGQDLGGKSLTPGVYCFSTSAQLTGSLSLNAQGNAAAVFLFKTGSTLTTASGSSVVITNGGSQCNVYWQVGSSATLGTSTAFAGNILALTSITATTGASVIGRALARNGAVTLDSNSITPSACAASGPGPTPVPLLPRAFVLLLALGLAGAGYLRLRRTTRAD
jgi:type VI secretion system secreted protein VgrG